ncbi:MAG: DUF362 domain-containing protein [Spirochaetia bacterium]|nr:DUF362 domain-containing protein [Spirochaetia bacterium]
MFKKIKSWLLPESLDVKIERREFLSRSFKGYLALIFSGSILKGKKLYAEVNMPNNSDDKNLVVIKSKDIKKETVFKMIDEGFKQMGGIEKFIRKGMNVVIKPNIGFNSPPERAHTTNPYIVEAVAKKCVSAGASVKILDRPVHTARLCYKNCGMTEAAKKSGASVHYVDDRKFKEVRVKNGLNLEDLDVYHELIKADFVINVPIAKDHKSANLTMAMKNLMGVIGGRRGWFHLSLHENIVDFNKAIPVHLVILDALRILTANGPASGTLKDVKETRTIIMGTNAVCVDAYTTRLFNKKPADIEYLTLAHKEKMGEIDANKMNIKNISL